MLLCVSSHLSIQLFYSNGSRPRAVGNGQEEPGTSGGSEDNLYVRFSRQRVVCICETKQENC